MKFGQNVCVPRGTRSRIRSRSYLRPCRATRREYGDETRALPFHVEHPACDTGVCGRPCGPARDRPSAVTSENEGRSPQ